MSLNYTAEGVKNREGQLWIPTESKLLKLRVVISGHTGEVTVAENLPSQRYNLSFLGKHEYRNSRIL